MSDIRRKLIELLYNIPTPGPVVGFRAGKKVMTSGFIADHLIRNGVTIPVRCSDCKSWDPEHCSDGQGWCPKVVGYRRGDWYCAAGERKDK